MSERNLPARILRRIISLFEEGRLDKSQIARRVGISRSTLWVYLKEYRHCGMRYPEILDINNEALLDKLLPRHRKDRVCARRAVLLATFPAIAEKFASEEMNLHAMWAQYRQHQPEGYAYSQFATHYNAWNKASGRVNHPRDTRKIHHIPEDEMIVLKMWRRSNDRRKWERAVVIMEAHKGCCLSTICSKVERARRLVQRWITGYTVGGLTGIPVQRSKDIAPATASRIAEKKNRIVEILHQPPRLYGVNRASWSLQELANTYEKEHGESISTSMISGYVRSMRYRFRKAKIVLTSTDPDYRVKLQNITRILESLGPREKFFSIDEYGPFAVKMQGGKSLVPEGMKRTVPQNQKSKGSLIVTAALKLSTNQVTHFYSEKKNTDEMIKLLLTLLKQYAAEECIYFSWDAASWHGSKKFEQTVEDLNDQAYRKIHGTPLVKLAPLPSCAQFLNVIESVFSGMAKAIIHNSDYGSVGECMCAIDKHFAKRNQHFKDDPKRAGNKIWGGELVKPEFSPRNNCKDPNWR